MNKVVRPAHPHYLSDITYKPFYYSEQIALATMHTKDAKEPNSWCMCITYMISVSYTGHIYVLLPWFCTCDKISDQ